MCALAEILSDNLAVARAVVGGAVLESGHASGGTILYDALYIAPTRHTKPLSTTAAIGAQIL